MSFAVADSDHLTVERAYKEWDCLPTRNVRHGTASTLCQPLLGLQSRRRSATRPLCPSEHTT